MDFYVYVHRRATDGSVFYVGKGRKYRAFAKNSRSVFWKNTVAKYGYTIEIVKDGMEEHSSLEMEIELISLYGRDNLVNLTDGGEGSSGYVHSEESKRIIGEYSKGNTNTKGMKHSEESKKKIGLGNKGVVFSDERKANISASLQGHYCSTETRKKLSVAHKGKEISQETRDKISKKTMGVKKPESMRIKIKKYMTEKNGIPITCSNGMKFPSKSSAVAWLKEIGHLKACVANISKMLLGEINSAYGYKWSISHANS